MNRVIHQTICLCSRRTWSSLRHHVDSFCHVSCPVVKNQWNKSKISIPPFTVNSTTLFIYVFHSTVCGGNFANRKRYCCCCCADHPKSSRNYLSRCNQQHQTSATAMYTQYIYHTIVPAAVVVLLNSNLSIHRNS